MRWEGRRQSENVEDRRGIGAPAMVGGGLFALLLMIGLMFLGVDPQQAVGISRGLAPAQQPRAQSQKPQLLSMSARSAPST
jgi:predicted metalloprotease